MERHIRVLIGCNEPAVVDAVRILLTTTAQDGRELQIATSRSYAAFIRQARSGEFDLAIMHANCLVPTRPLMLLEQAVSAVRSIKAFGSVRLVVLTTMDELVAPLRVSGADACLKTPFDADELLAAICGLI